MHHLISIVVPCYNQAQYLDECLQSVLDQTYQNWECIIVNDGSPDNTQEIAYNWLKKDKRFKYINKINGGLSSARNAGISQAKGTWILPLDADDIIGNRYLELASLDFDNGYTIIYSKVQFFGCKNEIWDLKPYDFHLMLHLNIIYCSGFYKKSDWERVNGYDENLIYGMEDWDFWIAILEQDSKVKYLDYLGFYYRIKEVSMINELNSNFFKLKFSERYILKKHKAKLDLYNVDYDNFYPQNKNTTKKKIYSKFLDLYIDTILLK